MRDVNNQNAYIGQQNIGGVVYNIYGDKKIPKILGKAPFITDWYLERDDDLKTVHRMLDAGENLLLLVNGQGGIGKTTLAAKYWQRYEKDYFHLAWAFVQDSLLDAILTLSEPLEVSYPEGAPKEQRLGILLETMLALQKHCLLVIDNANDPGQLGQYYIALRSCPNFHILLTTRITEFEQAAFHRIEPFGDDKALALFKKHYPAYREEENAQLIEIFRAVGYNTLVIELLAKNLHNLNRLKTRYGLSELLGDLQERGLLQLKSKTVKTAYQASGSGLREETPTDIIKAMYDLGGLSDSENALLSVFSVLPAERIDFGTLERLLPDRKGLDDALLSLAQKGWLDLNQEAKTFKISPVVQEVVKAKSRSLPDDCRDLIGSLIRELDKDVLHEENYRYSSLFARYAEVVLATTGLDDDELAILCQNLGNYHIDTGDLIKAMQAHENMARILQGLVDSDPDNNHFKNGLAISYEKLGKTHSALGNLEKALQFFEQYNQLEKELHSAYPQNVEFKNVLAISYLKLGRRTAR
ncbi:MAG: hypothetical protein H6575_11285 [Lewinellaceae bacterium]|nr:hypothetical protein [Lewinellaceae bacterium]